MFGLTDRRNKLAAVWVMFLYYWTYMTAIYKKLQSMQWITKTLVNDPKQELQRDYEWNNVSSDMKNTITY